MREFETMPNENEYDKLAKEYDRVEIRKSIMEQMLSGVNPKNNFNYPTHKPQSGVKLKRARSAAPEKSAADNRDNVNVEIYRKLKELILLLKNVHAASPSESARNGIAAVIGSVSRIGENFCTAAIKDRGTADYKPPSIKIPSLRVGLDSALESVTEIMNLCAQAVSQTETLTVFMHINIAAVNLIRLMPMK